MIRKQTIHSLPAPAQNIEVFLDVILQIINVIQALGRLLFGPNFQIFPSAQ